MSRGSGCRPARWRTRRTALLGLIGCRSIGRANWPLNCRSPGFYLANWTLNWIRLNWMLRDYYLLLRDYLRMPTRPAERCCLASPSGIATGQRSLSRLVHWRSVCWHRSELYYCLAKSSDDHYCSTGRSGFDLWIRENS